MYAPLSALPPISPMEDKMKNYLPIILDIPGSKKRKDG
jgi:hypothetical protein